MRLEEYGGVKLSETDEKARRAVAAFRSLQPILTSYAQMLTGNKDARVDVAASDNGSTDSTGRIYFRPPIELGDKTPHDRYFCDKRDPETGLQFCPACAVREKVLVTIYHEIGHNWFESFMEATDADKKKAIQWVAKESKDSAWRKSVAERLEKASYRETRDFVNLAKFINEFLPFIINVLEDARINTKLFETKPGTKRMFEADTRSVFEKGFEAQVGGQHKIIRWDEAPLNNQMMIGLLCKAQKYDYSQWFHPKVVHDLNDDKLTSIIGEMETFTTAAEVYHLSFRVLERLRELGYCGTPQDPDPEPQPKEEEQDEQGASDESDDSSNSEDSDQDSSDSEEVDEASDSSGGSHSGASTVQGSEGDGSSGGESDAGDSNKDHGDHSSDHEDGSESNEDPGGAESNRAGSTDSGESSGTEDEPECSGAGDQEELGDVDSGAEEQGRSVEGQPEGADARASEHDEFDELGDEENGQSTEDPSSGEAKGDSSDVPPSSGDSGSQSNVSEGGVEASSNDFDDDESESGDSDSHGLRREGSSADSSDSGSEHEGDTSSLVLPSDSDDDSRGGSDLTESGDDDSSVDSQGVSSGKSDVSGHNSSSGSEDSEELHSGDDRSGDLDELDTGADDGYGGTMVEDSWDEDSLPEMGDADDVMPALVKWNQHDEKPKQASMGTTNEKKAVDKAIIQGIYFTTPSANVEGVNVYDWKNRDDAPAWSDRDPKPIELEERILQPALGRMRRAFTDNKRAAMSRNRKSGRVDPSVLGRRAWSGDERLFHKKTLPGKKDYEVIIGMDISYSTVGVNLKLEKRAIMAQAEILSRMGIPFSIYAHSGGFGTTWGSDYSLEVYKLKERHEPWNEATQRRLLSIQAVMCNLDGHALEYLRKRADESNATDKIILYYSDGKMPAENLYEELDILKREIKYCSKHNYTLLGVGIRTDSPRAHGLDTVQVDSDEDLSAVVKHLEKRLSEGIVR